MKIIFSSGLLCVTAGCFAIILSCPTSASAQTKPAAKTPPGAVTTPTPIPKGAAVTKSPISLLPGRTIASPAKPIMVYADSTKFKAAFSELYTVIRPTLTIRERAEQEFKRMSRTFKSHGVDSSIAYEKIMKAIDPAMDEKILFRAYRQEFSVDQVKSLSAFFKTSAGQKYLSAQNRLGAAQFGAISQYVSHTVNSVVSPLMKPVDHQANINSTTTTRPAPLRPPADTTRERKAKTIPDSE